MERIITFDYWDNIAHSWQSFMIEASDFGIYGMSPEEGIEIQYGDVRVDVIENGRPSPYEITAVSWSGYHLGAEDALLQTIRGYLNNEGNYNVKDACSVLYAFKQDCPITISAPNLNRTIAPLYFDTVLGYVLPLVYATQEYAFYAYDDIVVMLDAQNNIVSNNNFANDWLYQVIEDVIRGEDIELFAGEGIEDMKREIASELDIEL